MKFLVINLPEHTERLQSFQENWNWLGDIEVVPGVRHAIPHSGCGLAHVNAVRRGLAESEVCLVFEDDARFDGDRDEFLNILKTLPDCSSQWDAIVLGVEGDGARRDPVSALRVHPLCLQLSPSEVPSQTHVVMWSRSALPIIAEYEKIIMDGYFLPIDRFLFMDSWYHQVWARWEPIRTSKEIANSPWLAPSNDLLWNIPRTWICDHPSMSKLIQSDMFMSEHSGKHGNGYLHKQVTAAFLADARSRAVPGSGRPSLPANIRAGRKPTGFTANVVCTARDVEDVFAKEALEVILAAFDNYKFIVVESNSTDKTVDVLREFCSLDVRRHLISLSPDTDKTRPQRIARARNEYMNHLDTSFDFVVVVDVDDSLDVDMNFSECLRSCTDRTDWDGISSNRRSNYYDAWALRSAELGFVQDPYLQIEANPSIGCKVMFQDKIDPNRSWISCESAFGCLTVYKTPSVIGRTYNGDKTCEHVPFNTGLRMFIVPSFMSGGKYVARAGQIFCEGQNINVEHRWV